MCWLGPTVFWVRRLEGWMSSFSGSSWAVMVRQKETELSKGHQSWSSGMTGPWRGDCTPVVTCSRYNQTSWPENIIFAFEQEQVVFT